jgi:S-adenosylmethionine:tRNA ribosyltransferase-isomerase
MKKKYSIPDFEMSSFDYRLPADQIAETPLPDRDASKLLVWKNGAIQHDQYLNLADHLPSNALLVFNNSKVIAARLKFKKSTGGEIEIFLLEPADGDYKALHDLGKSNWKCMVGGIKKWKQQETLLLPFESNGKYNVIKATSIERKEDHCIINFAWDQHMFFHELLVLAGRIPLPPYIKRLADENDKSRYQTVYAKHEGSVAAPTAGLHFTERIFKSLESKNITHAFVTLHVGAGTFKPVSSSTIADHAMHEEFYEVDLAMINSLGNAEKMIIAVGTTSARTLESLYWIGLKLIKNIDSPNKFELEQWEYLQLQESEMPHYTIVFRELTDYMAKKKMKTIRGYTGICITPAYTFRVIQGMITNFHQPQSTLLLLISAIMKDEWKKTYEIALKKGYRFLSYGDGSLLFIS